uniref:Uncharacterized protein n=1 Tax=Anguilla anguilla TaxID=7936 RepID=A0A0E9Q634_ANGAN
MYISNWVNGADTGDVILTKTKNQQHVFSDI